MTALSDLAGGLLAVAGTLVVAFFGWLATRGSTASSTAEWLVGELRQEVDERDKEIAALRAHVEQCEIDNAKMAEALGRAEKKIGAILRLLRSTITAEQLDSLLADLGDLDDPEGG